MVLVSLLKVFLNDLDFLLGNSQARFEYRMLHFFHLFHNFLVPICIFVFQILLPLLDQMSGCLIMDDVLENERTLE